MNRYTYLLKLQFATSIAVAKVCLRWGWKDARRVFFGPEAMALYRFVIYAAIVAATIVAYAVFYGCKWLKGRIDAHVERCLLPAANHSIAVAVSATDDHNGFTVDSATAIYRHVADKIDRAARYGYACARDAYRTISVDGQGAIYRQRIIALNRRCAVLLNRLNLIAFNRAAIVFNWLR